MNDFTEKQELKAEAKLYSLSKGEKGLVLKDIGSE
jgi:hypothetical protein